jgi:hypothetical protein
LLQVAVVEVNLLLTVVAEEVLVDLEQQVQ